VKKSLWAYIEWKRKLNRNQDNAILRETDSVICDTSNNALHNIFLTILKEFIISVF